MDTWEGPEGVRLTEVSLYSGCLHVGSKNTDLNFIVVAVTNQEIDCKTVRIFAYSSTREQSNKRSGMRLKTESETGERH